MMKMSLLQVSRTELTRLRGMERPCQWLPQEQATVMSELKTRTVRELLASSGNEFELPVRIIVT